PDYHPWICVEPAQFSRNHTSCRVQVDTTNLMADKLYKRQLLLRTNAYPEIYPLIVQVQTAPVPIEKLELQVSYARLAGIFLFFAVLSIIISWAIAVGGSSSAGVGVVVGVVVGAVFGALVVLVDMLVGVAAARDVINTAQNKSIAIPLLLFTIGLGISFGIGCIVGLFNPYILLALAGTGLPLAATLLLYQSLQRRSLIAQYRKSEKRLIKP
ncbi:MAG: hypothetical protein EA343_04485, partial [Nodularia sp. (in: Bacteria)]